MTRPSGIVIAPSILTADFGALAEQIRAAERGGAGRFHLDVMDGHFVPQLSFGPLVVDAVRRATALPLEVHLMVSEPVAHFASFAEVGAKTLLFHVEATPEPRTAIEAARALGCAVGVAISPETPVAAAEALLGLLDEVVVMLVRPGRGGQAMMSEHLEKVRRLRAAVDRAGLSVAIEVDGGVKAGNVSACIAAGADILVAGSATYRPGITPEAALAEMRDAIAG